MSQISTPDLAFAINRVCSLKSQNIIVMKQSKTGYEEAGFAITRKFQKDLSLGFSGNVLHTDGSSPYASLRAHQVLVVLSALINTDANIITVTTSSGFFQEFNSLWKCESDIDWRFGKDGFPYHFQYDVVKSYVPVIPGGLVNYSEQRRRKIIELCERLLPGDYEHRLIAHDMANTDLFKDITFADYVKQSSFGDRIGKFPCPYCTIRHRRKFKGDNFIYHNVRNSPLGICSENYHAKCPAKRILVKLLDRPLVEVIRQTGFAITGRASFRFFASNLKEFNADSIAIKDYEKSAGAMDYVVEAINDFRQLVVTTRTMVNKNADEFLSADRDDLLKVILSHPVVSCGGVFEI